MFRAAVTLSFLCCVMTPTRASAQVPDSVATLLPAQLVTEPGFFEGMTEIAVVNKSPATITAWSVRLHCAGERPRSRGHSVDAWITLERSPVNGPDVSVDGFIAPAATVSDRQLACGPQGRGELPATVTLDWLIFDDGTWAGDPAGVRRAFAARRSRRDDWATTLTVLEDVEATHSGRDALLAAKRRLAPLSNPHRPNSATDTLHNIEIALDGCRANQPSPDYFWRKLVDEARFQVSAADRHISPAASQPLPPPVRPR